MKNKKATGVYVGLNHYVKIYGDVGFVVILEQLLKEFVDTGVYPENLKPHNELAQEIHEHLLANGLYTAIHADKREYRLRIGYWDRPSTVVTYESGGGNHVILPDMPWFISVQDKDPTFTKEEP